MSKFKLKVSARLMRKKNRKQAYVNNKRCRVCGSKDMEDALDYKNVDLLKGFLTERGKILPSRVSGNCFRHQRELTRNIKIARSMALIPYCSIHI